MFRYEPPANWNDFQGHPQEQRAHRGWSEWILANFRVNIDDLRSEVPSPLFFSEAEQPIPQQTRSVPVPWNGFPKVLALQHGGSGEAAWQAADALGVIRARAADGSTVDLPFRRQDEYLEWLAITDDEGNATRYVFTCEGPEYWSHLARFDHSLLLERYRQLVGEEVELQDLLFEQQVTLDRRTFRAGEYNPWNVWNTERGIVHLTHPANTLAAEINLAARATIPRRDATGQLITDAKRLACCSNFGEPNRSSDPTIGQAVNLAVQGGISVTLENPLGLYIRSMDLGRISGPDGETLDDWWRITRGQSDYGLRAEFGPPDRARFGVPDVLVKGSPLRRGGQLAELITMVLYARAHDFGLPDSPMLPCVARCCMPEGTPDPEQAVLEHVVIDRSCRRGTVDAYPDLTEALDLRIPVQALSRLVMEEGQDG
jgi:hypothetical protein